MLTVAKLLILFHLFDWSAAQTANSTLKSVQILFRHGTREADAVFGQPLGALKPSGKKQMYDVGRFFRKRYGDLVKAEYDEHDIFIMSTDYDRTIQSALLVAFGLFKDFNVAANWNDEEKINFEPIPIRTLHKKYDKYIQMQSDCPRRTQLETGVLNSYFSRYLEENRELIYYYANHSGDQTILDSSRASRERVNGMILFQQQIAMNQTDNLPIVDWAQPLAKNEAFLFIETGAMYEVVNSVEKQKFHTGPLVKLLIENMEEPPEIRKKIYLFSGHDRTLTLLLFSLNIFDPLVFTMPPTGSSLIVELHEHPYNGSSPFVQFWFRNDSQNEPYLFEIPNCGSPCYLSVFKKLTEQIVPADFEAECINQVSSNSNVKKEVQTLSQINILLICLVLTLVIIFIGSVQIINFSRRNYRSLE